VGPASYYRTVLARGWRDAVALLTRQGIFLGLLITVLTALITGRVGAEVGERFNVGLAVYAAVLAVVAVAVLALIGCLAAAPWRLHRDLEDRARDLERRLREQLERPDVSRLVALRERAVTGLRNRRVDVDKAEELEALQRDLRAWEQDVGAELERVGSRADTSRFRVLGDFTAYVTVIPGEEPPRVLTEYHHEMAMLSERLSRLMAIIDRIEGGGSRPSSAS
jgi:hypothetical protein